LLQTICPFVYDGFMDAKTTGYTLLGFGIFIMTFSVVLVILAFTGVIKPSYFSTASFTQKENLGGNDTRTQASNQVSTSGELDQLEQSGSLSSLLPNINIIPAGALSDMLNLSAHFFLMTFLAGFGYKLAMIGVNLVRPIVIKTGDKILTSQDTQV